MKSYAKWKLLKSELNDKLDEYGQVANWCNQNGYSIKDDGEYFKVEKHKIEYTHEMIESFRQVAYAQEVDPITAHINRLRDEEQTDEIIAEIDELKEERKQKVQEIKERFPYNE